ncbi:hypothetical protein DVJ83_18065 (plasmid) [Deinococcus wulumuqiensis]|uniref:Uncharacterized protein n=1 Tax=Deinococcus wulumuqiensis TaxID=980427 RepID=A0A345INA8_9DEIO|nr:hypothetical protein DVJ83_18065 [Deinococcus wulumuqiensis]
MYDRTLYDSSRGHFYAGLTRDELEAKLTEYGITPPPGMLDAINEDARLNRGNTLTTWQPAA